MTPAPGRVPLPLPDPPLTSGSLALRPWSPGDAPALVRAWADADIARWTGVPRTPTLATARRWIAGEEHRRARGLSLDLVVDVDGALAGEVGLVAVSGRSDAVDLGWWTAADRRGRGTAQTAAHLLAGWAVEELCIDLVLARCAEDNPASGAVARAAGFALVAAADGIQLWSYGPSAPAATIGT
ncbi:MAG: GNAT family N-acetyltransferase [Acidimicrobiales bacterium]